MKTLKLEKYIFFKNKLAAAHSDSEWLVVLARGG